MSIIITTKKELYLNSYDCAILQLLQAFRNGLVPDGYEPFPFRANTPESYLDQLRTVAATLTMRHTIEHLKEMGRDFTKYVYIPEVDEETGHVHHDRADHCHLLKRIAG